MAIRPCRLRIKIPPDWNASSFCPPVRGYLMSCSDVAHLANNHCKAALEHGAAPYQPGKSDSYVVTLENAKGVDFVCGLD